MVLGYRVPRLRGDTTPGVASDVGRAIVANSTAVRRTLARLEPSTTPQSVYGALTRAHEALVEALEEHHRHAVAAQTSRHPAPGASS